MTEWEKWNERREVARLDAALRGAWEEARSAEAEQPTARDAAEQEGAMTELELAEDAAWHALIRAFAQEAGTDHWACAKGTPEAREVANRARVARRMALAAWIELDEQLHPPEPCNLEDQ